MDPTEDMESSYSAGENVKWHIYFAETDWQLKKKVNIYILYDPLILLPSITREMKTYIYTKNCM